MYVEVLSIKSPAWKRYFKLMSEHLLLYLKNIFENYKTICHYHMTFHRNEGFGSYVQMNFAAPVIKEKINPALRNILMFVLRYFVIFGYRQRSCHANSTLYPMLDKASLLRQYLAVTEF